MTADIDRKVPPIVISTGSRLTIVNKQLLIKIENDGKFYINGARTGAKVVLTQGKVITPEGQLMPIIIGKGEEFVGIGDDGKVTIGEGIDNGFIIRPGIGQSESRIEAGEQVIIGGVWVRST